MVRSMDMSEARLRWTIKRFFTVETRVLLNQKLLSNLWQSNHFQYLWYSMLHFVESFIYFIHEKKDLIRGNDSNEIFKYIKYYELYHCYICKMILKVIQWSLTRNILWQWRQWWQQNLQIKFTNYTIATFVKWY